MQVVKLKNGSEEPLPRVLATVKVIEVLLKNQPVVFYEAVMVARDPDHEPVGNIIQDLNHLALTKDGEMHDSIRNVILSAVSGEDSDMVLDSPIEWPNQDGGNDEI